MLLFALLLTFSSEGLELAFNIVNPFWTGVIISIPFFFLGAAIENVYSKIDFRKNILQSIKNLKETREKHDLKPEPIQDLMEAYTNLLIVAFNQKVNSMGDQMK
ncbi:MAG: hypothetical protein IPL84_00795 [Chitinophagaceae bacterium]|nr:hypothetical protein [Chitinophagaceae bacterium]